MSLHHVGIVHGSGPNTSDIPRTGFAICYIAKFVRQTGGCTTATLARGEDTHGHFDLESRPHAECDDACLMSRQTALAGQHAVLFSGLQSDISGRFLVYIDSDLLPTGQHIVPGEGVAVAQRLGLANWDHAHAAV